ncbi:MAG: folylpolyglutamate synthase/dihydrofolate synthase family protein [bacterium]
MIPYEQTIKYLYDLQPIGIKFGLHNTLCLLNYFHNPHEKIRTIHVAGTNGKGSTCSMIASVLQAAGYRVGLYTSPHLVDFTERISINGLRIARLEVVRLTERIQEAIAAGDFESGHPTFFEVVTVMALAYFQEQQVDFAIMEVGMGGRLDATNVIEPLLGIITNIDLDHQQYLGNSLLDIAREKAGIIKKGMPLVTGVQQPEVMELLSDICLERGAVLIPVPLSSSSLTRPLSQSLAGQSFEIVWPDEPSQQFSISLIGEHQIQNALVALRAIQVLSRMLPGGILLSQITEGMSRARWPGRAESYPGVPPVMVDGAHNPAGARRLACLLKGLGFPRLILVLGIMKDKEIAGICQELVPLASRVVLTRPSIARASSPEEILDIITSRCLVSDRESISITESIPEAITLARTVAHPKDLICVTGSLFTVGEAKVFLDAR